jgi:glycosyltransferase involved in cell wall biosynthesis
MKVLLAVTSLKSAYGGPARSVSRLGIELARHGVELGLWAPDGSAGSLVLPDDSTVRRLSGPISKAMEELGRPDLIHDNGIWMPHNHQLALLAKSHGIPRVVSSRGMLEPWAMHHKRWKKCFAWWLYQQRDLRLANGVHVTSAPEERTVQRLQFRMPVRMIPNGIECPPLEDWRNTYKEGTERIALFVGRLHPVKGLPMLLEAWAQVRPAGWILKITGPDEAGHLAELQALREKWMLTDLVQFTGSLENDALKGAYRSADLFVLPSYTENFGMAVGEAMSWSLPVIATKGTPWEILVRRDCGWWVDTKVSGLAAGLEAAISLPSAKLLEMGRRGRAVAEEQFEWTAITRQFIKFYQEVACL